MTTSPTTSYVCLDGPLEGRSFRWRHALPDDEPVTVGLLDVDHAVLEVDYRVQLRPDPPLPGLLAFDGCRDGSRLEDRRTRTRRPHL